MHPITVEQGPTVSRGLLSILGLGMDLGGPGAAEFGGNYLDPLDTVQVPATDPEGHEILNGEGRATYRPETGTRWMNGYQPISVPCQRQNGLQPPFPCGSGEAFNRDPDAEDEDENPIPVVDLSTPPWELGADGHAFEVEGPNIECSTLGIGGWTDVQAVDASRTAHRDLLWRRIARELWTGELADEQGWTTNKRLAGPDTIVLGEGLSLPRALMLLEGRAAAMASRDERVVIHAPWSTSPYFACESLYVSTMNGDRYYTPGGSLISFDVGYPGSSPTDPLDAPVPDEDTGEITVWLYSTLRLSARLGEAYQRQGKRPMSAGTGIRAATNDVTLAYRQPALITFPCDVFGVSVVLG